MKFKSAESIPRISSGKNRHVLDIADQALDDIDYVLGDSVQLKIETEKSNLHGPMRPGFDYYSDLAEIDRAVEDGTLSEEDAKRIINIIDSAPSGDAVEDAILREFYKGDASPDPLYRAQTQQTQQ